MEVKVLKVINRRLWWPHEWPEGPWDDEPDMISYTDPASGLPCLILREPSAGTLNGYVGVPPGHSWHGQDVWQMKDPPCVHEGVTLSVEGLGESKGFWFFGYDCNHLMDYAPGAEAMFAYLNVHYPDGDGLFPKSYKRVEYLMDQNALLAGQILAAAPKALTA